MHYDKKGLADKALGGDDDAMGMLVLISPSESMGDMSEDEYAKHVSSCDQEAPEEDVTKVMQLLLDAGLPEEQAMSVASGVFETLGYY